MGWIQTLVFKAPSQRDYTGEEEESLQIATCHFKQTVSPWFSDNSIFYALRGNNDIELRFPWREYELLAEQQVTSYLHIWMKFISYQSAHTCPIVSDIELLIVQLTSIVWPCRRYSFSNARLLLTWTWTELYFQRSTSPA